MLRCFGPFVTFVAFCKSFAASALCASVPLWFSAAALQRFEFSQAQMGIPFRIVLYAKDAHSAELSSKAAFDRVAELNAKLSDYDSDSELSRLSQTAGEDRWVRVSDDLWQVLRQSQALGHRSYGAFDVTVGPCVGLWRKARRERKIPEAGRLLEARAAVGYQKLLLREKDRTAKLLAPGMKLDLGGIAKGYAVDEALRVLRSHGIHRALVAAAGDLAVSGAPPGKKGWRIEIATLDASNAPPPQFVIVKNAAVATSGDVFQHLEVEGKRYSHIVDPRKGIGLTDHSLVTIIAPNCTLADGLATAVSVLGPEDGLKLVNETCRVSARILRRPGETIMVYRSKGWPGRPALR